MTNVNNKYIYYFMILEVSSPKNQGVGRLELPSEALRENIFPFFFQLLEITCHPLFMVLFSLYRSSSIASSPPLTLTFYFHCYISILWSFSFFYKDSCDYMEPTRVIQDNFFILRYLITYAKSHLLYKVTYSQDQDIFGRLLFFLQHQVNELTSKIPS